ncbi:MAG: zinc ribbon domain-containing protein [Methanomassiliicoccaceae archaeon]|nr:zinc ribbon domain-containing protein [Methanomassiliicoccaceae archaeon]
MLKSFTRNHNDNSTDAGFEFVFYCDVCNDGYKSSFIESETYKKKKGSKLIGQGASLIGNLAGGRARTVGNAASQGGGIASQQFEGKTPEWHKEHEAAFEKAQNEAMQHFHRCPGCNKYVCDQCWNEDAMLCTSCAPRQEVAVAQAHAKAMKRNIDDAGSTATVWEGKIESKTTMCPACGKPAGTGKFCNNCGASMEQKECPKCGSKNALSTRFCNNCGENLQAVPAPPAAPSGKCSSCGFDNPPGTKFCGQCGGKLE